MVDLVKIRKKAKKKEEASSAEAPPVTSPEPAGHPDDRLPERSAESPSLPSAEPPPPAPAKRASEPPEPPPQNASEPAPVASSKLEKFKEQAGRRRTTGESAAVEQTSAQKVELLTFVIAGEHYAVDIERIVEIVTPRGVTRIPNTDPSIVGIMSLRGTIVTLVDARRRLKHPAAGAPSAETRIVVIDMKNEMIGFMVDRVLRVIKTEQSEIEPHPVVHNTELDESILGVFRTAAALTILLDLDKLLESRTVVASSA